MYLITSFHANVYYNTENNSQQIMISMLKKNHESKC